MEHSIESYLQRQSTEVLEMLLLQYEQTEDVLGLAALIRSILEQRYTNT